MAITIRLYSTADIPAIYDLIIEFAAFQKTPEKVMITPQQMQDEKELFQCMVAQNDDGKIVGFASFFFVYYSWSGKALYLDDLYIQPAYRGAKTGTNLLMALKEFAINSKCRKMRWQVSKWNSDAITFYKSIGAVIDDVEINCDLYL